MKPNGYYFMANGKESFHFFAMFMVGKLKIHLLIEPHPSSLTLLVGKIRFLSTLFFALFLSPNHPILQ